MNQSSSELLITEWLDSISVLVESGCAFLTPHLVDLQDLGYPCMME